MPPTSPEVEAAPEPSADRPVGLDGSEAGFTLLETMLALAILSLVILICFPRTELEAGLPLALLRTVGETGALLREDRNAALAKGQVVSSEVDLGRRSIRSGTTGRRLDLTEQLDIRAQFGASGERRGIFSFFPDGRSTGGSINIGYGALTYRVTINPLTSAITIEHSSRSSGDRNWP